MKNATTTQPRADAQKTVGKKRGGLLGVLDELHDVLLEHARRYPGIGDQLVQCLSGLDHDDWRYGIRRQVLEEIGELFHHALNRRKEVERYMRELEQLSGLPPRDLCLKAH